MSLATREEIRLVERCLEGEAAAWAELVERYSRYVYAIATRGHGLGEHDAEDVFQEVFARTYEHLRSLRDPGALRSWIGQLARRVAIDRLRASGREQITAEPPQRATVEDPGAQIEEALVVRSAMQALPEDCVQILDRFFARDQSYRTISAELEIPEGTVASRISRCLARLKNELEEQGVQGRSSAARAS